MQQYLDICRQILDKGRLKKSRAGDTIGIFGAQMRFDLSDGFPLVTTKKVFTRGIFEELKWLMMGNSNISFLKDQNVNIWNEWATETGDIGPCYPTMWRQFPSGVPTAELRAILTGVSDDQHLRERVHQLATEDKYQPIDQLAQLFSDLKTKPFSRRHLLTSWSPNVLPDETISPVDNARQGRQALAACHTFFQLYVEQLSEEEARELMIKRTKKACEAAAFELGRPDLFTPNEVRTEQLDGLLDHYNQDLKWLNNADGQAMAMLPTKRLSLQLYQRSADFPLGVPFNIASYAALTQILAEKSGMIPGDFIWTGGDCHVYINQIEQLEGQVRREPLPLPWLDIRYGYENPEQILTDVENYYFNVIGYQSHPAIKFPPPAV